MIHRKILSAGGGAGGQIIAGCTNGAFALTSDGTNWTYSTSGPFYANSTAVTQIAYGNGKYVAVGGAYIATSPDGVTWTSQTNPNGSTSFNGVAFQNGYFVAIYTWGVFRSSDGVTWSDITSSARSGLPGSGNGGATTFSYIRGGNGRFYIMGSNATNDQNFADVGYSTDGSSWTSVGPPNTGAQSPYGSGGGGAGVVPLGNNIVCAYVCHSADSSYYAIKYQSSDNGNSFSGASYTLGYGYNLLGANDTSSTNLVICSTSGWSNSTDGGSTWGSPTTGLNGGYGVIYANTFFIGADNTGKICTSTYGSSWTNTTTLSYGVNCLYY